jgi:hypothetical protein
MDNHGDNHGLKTMAGAGVFILDHHERICRTGGNKFFNITARRIAALGTSEMDRNWRGETAMTPRCEFQREEREDQGRREESAE